MKISICSTPSHENDDFKKIKVHAESIILNYDILSKKASHETSQMHRIETSDKKESFFLGLKFQNFSNFKSFFVNPNASLYIEGKRMDRSIMK